MNASTDFAAQRTALWRQLQAAHPPGANLAALDRALIRLWRQASTTDEQQDCLQLEHAIQALNDVKARRTR